MSRSFPGGVADDAGELGFVTTGPDDMACVRLSTGAVLWRRRGLGRPIAAASGRLLTLNDEGDAPVLGLLDAESGRQRASIAKFGLADLPAVRSKDTLQVEASGAPNGFEVVWRLRALYRGGAPPPPDIERQGANLSGAFLVKFDTGELVASGRPTTSAAVAAAADQNDRGGVGIAGPDALGHGRIGDRLYTLRIERSDSGPMLILEAREVDGGNLCWRSELAKVEGKPPAPLRH